VTRWIVICLEYKTQAQKRREHVTHAGNQFLPVYGITIELQRPLDYSVRRQPQPLPAPFGCSAALSFASGPELHDSHVMPVDCRVGLSDPVLIP
jgi:hypothetical protein